MGYSTVQPTVSREWLLSYVPQPRSVSSLSNNNCSGADLNDKILPATFNYNNPSFPFIVNGKFDPTSQRLHVSPVTDGLKLERYFVLFYITIYGVIYSFAYYPQDTCTESFSQPIPVNPPFDLKCVTGLILLDIISLKKHLL